MNILESPIGILFKRPVILAIFVVITAVNGVLSGLAGDTQDAWMVGIMAFMTYGVLALLAYKRFRIAILAMVFVMLFNGIGSLFESFRNLIVEPSHQTGMNLLAFTAGVYMVVGALILFTTRHDKE